VIDRLKDAATLTPAEAEALDKVKSVLGHLPEVRLGKALVGWAKRVTARPLAHDVPAADPEAEN
jgi:hypothetical protein